MTVTELLPWLNVLLVPILGHVLRIERRLTRLEALREADMERRRLFTPATTKENHHGHQTP